MREYFRPLSMTDPARPPAALALAGGWCWFDRVEVLRRGAPAEIVAATDLPRDVLERLCAPRAPLAGLSLARPRLMGVLNVTPDSFSDGGRYRGVGRRLSALDPRPGRRSNHFCRTRPW